MPPLQGILPVALLTVASCETQRPSFMSRIREDCAAGDRWACDLLDTLSHPPPTSPLSSPHARSDAPFFYGISVGRHAGSFLHGMHDAGSSPDL
jgi:hypothetical protein